MVTLRGTIFEAAIATEHLKAQSFAETNWEKILELYQQLYAYHPTPITLLNQAVVLLQLSQYQEAYHLLQQIDPASLEQRSYLYFGTEADYYDKIGEMEQALACLEKAIQSASNETEKQYLESKKQRLWDQFPPTD